jgi:hypothetical protein
MGGDFGVHIPNEPLPLYYNSSFVPGILYLISRLSGYAGLNEVQ